MTRPQKSRSSSKIKKSRDRTSKINSWLLTLAEKTENELEFWRAFQNFLAEQREIRRTRISEALISSAVRGFKSNQFVRIVDTRFQNRPLSPYGSIVVPPGGRFNIGPISTYYKTFQALYLASDFETAFFERFLRDPSKIKNDIHDPRDARLDPAASFSSYRVKVELDLVLDLREKDSLAPFLEIIAEIKAPQWLTDLAKDLKQPPPATVKTLEQLHTIIFDPNFTQWGSLLDQPSASQWLGLYAYTSGLNGIIYPSVRNSEGFAIVIFPETFEDSSCTVSLVDYAASVSELDQVLDSKTFMFQMLSNDQIKSIQIQ